MTTYTLTLELFHSWLNTICNDKSYRNKSVCGIFHVNTGNQSIPYVQVVQVDEEKETQGQITTDLLQCVLGRDDNIPDAGVGPGGAGDAAAVAVIGGAAAVAVAPALIATLGFAPAGIVGGSLAAAIMSSEAILFGGGVPSWGLTATLQSAGAVGMGIGAATGAFALGALGTYGIAKAFKSKPQRIGHLAGPAFLKDGNVVAFYSPEHNRFLRLTKDNKVDGFGGKISYDRLTTEFNSERFLVVGHVSNNPNEVALYSISHKSFLKVDCDDTLVGGAPINRSEQEIFQVRNDENGNINFYSPFVGKYVRMHPDGSVDCGAGEHNKAWENFILIVITAVARCEMDSALYAKQHVTVA